MIGQEELTRGVGQHTGQRHRLWLQIGAQVQFEPWNDLPPLPGLEIAFRISRAGMRLAQSASNLIQADVRVTQGLNLAYAVEVHAIVVRGSSTAMWWRE